MPFRTSRNPPVNVSIQVLHPCRREPHFRDDRWWSSGVAEPFSSSMASCSQFFGSSRRAAFNCCGPALTANSAQRRACLRHSHGSPGMSYAPPQR